MAEPFLIGDAMTGGYGQVDIQETTLDWGEARVLPVGNLPRSPRG